MTDPPARVLLTADAVGGVLTQVTDLARAFAGRGIAVDLVIVGPEPGPQTRERLADIPGVRVHETGLPLEWMTDRRADVLEAARRLADLSDALAPDVVHLANPAHAAAGDWHVPLAVTLHSCMATWWQAVKPDVVPPAELAWRTRLVRAGLEASDAAIAPSAAFAEAAGKLYGRRRFCVVRNGRACAPPVDPAAPRRGALATGRLWDEGKNVAAVEAAAALTDVPVRVAGPLEGPNGARAPRLAAATALGPLSPEAVRAALASARTYVSTALYEPFGLGVLEAAQAGCALVLSDIPTFRELWDGAAEFVDPRSAGEVAGAIERIERTPPLAAALGEAARRRAERMTAATMAAATLSAYATARAVSAGRILHFHRGVA